MSGSPPTSTLPARARAGLLAAFVLSGAAGLVYQVAWQRALTWVFGVDLYATTTVVACFLLGLGLGSALAARHGQAVRFPGRAYALLEVFIAVAGLLSLHAFELVQDADRLLVSSGLLVTSSAAHLATRFTLVLLVMVAPTAAMGATLPLLVRAAGVNASQGSGGIGLVYGANTAGALAGSLVTGFWLIRTVGVSGAVAVAAALNLGAALLAGWLFRSRAEPGGAVVDAAASSPSGARRLEALYAVSGFAALGLEVVWMRKYVLLLDHTIYTFSLVLALYLGGLALGSLIGARIADRFADRRTLVAGALAALALAVGLTAQGYAVLPSSVFLGGLGSTVFQIAGLMLVPTFLLGALFPLVSRRMMDLGLPAGLAVARTAVANTLGCVAGTVATGFLLLPHLGTWGTELLLAVLFACCAVVALAGRGGRPLVAVGFTAIAAVGLAAATPQDPLGRVIARRAAERIVWTREGAHGIATIGLGPSGLATLRLNGMSEGTPFSPSYPANLFSHLPALLAAEPRRAFVVGLGSGNTSAAFLAHPGMSVRIAELAEEIRAASGLMMPDGVFASPRSQIVAADARQELALRSEKYDVILSGTRPFVYMAGNLYSADYWRLCESRLQPGGLQSQWIRGADPEHLRLLLRTFISVFPEATAWETAGELCLLGSRQPLRISQEELRRRMHAPGTREALEAAGLREPVDVYRRFRRSASELRRLAGDGPVSTDDRPLTEFPSGRAPDGVWAREVLEPSRSSDVVDALVDVSAPERESLREVLRAPAAAGRP